MPSQSHNFSAKNITQCNNCQEDDCAFCQLNQNFNNLQLFSLEAQYQMDQQQQQDIQHQQEDENDEQQQQFEQEQQNLQQQFDSCQCCQGNVYECQGEICQHLGYCHCYAHYLNEMQYQQEQDMFEEVFQDYCQLNNQYGDIQQGNQDQDSEIVQQDSQDSDN